MPKKKVVLNFPPHLIDQPITYKLIKEHGLVVNILKARITPKEWGRMIVELRGGKEKMDAGIKYLEGIGVNVEPLAGEVRWLEERCIHCTACLAPCPSHALDVNRASMAVAFDREKCIACELCLGICPYGAIEMLFG